MKSIKFVIKGNWGHFRKAETNNNPLSHDMMTKTALIGLIGAVLGVERLEMKSLYPQLCDDFLYSVQINNTVQKLSCGFTYRSIKDAFYQAPKQIELIRNPNYTIVLALKAETSNDIFQNFKKSLQNNLAVFNPVLGLHNCPAELFFLEEGDLLYNQGEFETKGFISNNHKPLNIAKLPRLGFDKIPTYQNNDFWNHPHRFQQVIYPTDNFSLSSFGEYYSFNNQSFWFMV
jgi:CRISPR-associated Cas5-like protein